MPASLRSCPLRCQTSSPVPNRLAMAQLGQTSAGFSTVPRSGFQLSTPRLTKSRRRGRRWNLYPSQRVPMPAEHATGQGAETEFRNDSCRRRTALFDCIQHLRHVTKGGFLSSEVPSLVCRAVDDAAFAAATVPEGLPPDAVAAKNGSRVGHVEVLPAFVLDVRDLYRESVIPGRHAGQIRLIRRRRSALSDGRRGRARTRWLD